MKNSGLPTALLRSDTCSDLTPEQQLSLSRRIAYVDEILHAAVVWLNAEGVREERVTFVEDLELDITSALYSGFGEDACVSAWLIHTTWSWDLEGQARHYLAPTVLAQLASPLVALDEEDPVFDSWLAEEVAAARLVLGGLQSADSASAAIAHLIAIDGFLTRILAVLCIRRLT